MSDAYEFDDNDVIAPGIYAKEGHPHKAFAWLRANDPLRRVEPEGFRPFRVVTKHKDVIVGPAYLRAYVAWGGRPHLAIGGVTAANVGQLVEAGARGVAVSSGVCGAREPGQVVHAMVEAITAVGVGQR